MNRKQRKQLERQKELEYRKQRKEFEQQHLQPATGEDADVEPEVPLDSGEESDSEEESDQNKPTKEGQSQDIIGLGNELKL